MIDDLILGFDRALRTLSGTAASGRPNPARGLPESDLTPEERRHAAGLMRVNHTGEVCAQALYQAQALTAREAGTRDRLLQAAREEEEHEVRHGIAARDAGAVDLPWLVRALMRAAARVMTSTAYRL
jgi:demethoxyubiquinone hydroxylase (CLK1/Coq7/Cat5 family)